MRDGFYKRLAYRLPRSVIYHCLIRACAHTMEKESVNDLAKISALTVLWNWREIEFGGKEAKGA